MIITWMERPARASFTPTWLAPEVLVERAPPEPWRMRQTMSAGMKIQ
jgi:hypothetical protein